jgi:hypothetical protein
MMEFKILPYQGVNAVRFEMTREEVHRILGDKVNEYRDQYLIDSFQDYKPAGSISIMYSYQFPHFCKAFVISPPHKAVFQGRDLLRTPIQDLLEWFTSMDGDVVGDNTNAITYKFGIFLWAGGDPLARFSDEDYSEELTEEESETSGTWTQSVTVFERGFYDEHRKYYNNSDLMIA